MYFFTIFAIPFAYLLELFYKLFGNYAISIIVLSVLVRGAVYPIYKKQIIASVNMGKIQPKIKAIQRKYANDKAMLNQKMAELYKEEKFNPMAGCLPGLIQMIVIMGLFTLLRNPIHFIQNDSMYFAIHESFLWIPDLSQPDLWILPILAGIATFLSTFLSSVQMEGQPGGNAMQVMMKYVFPIIIIWLARSYPAALAIYWFVSQTMQIFFNLHLNKIKKELKEGDKKKKSKKVNA